MIDSVNFIERPKFVWSYFNFFRLSVVLFILGSGVGLFERVTLQRTQDKVDLLRQEVAQLQKKLNLATSSDTDASHEQDKAVYELYQKISTAPKWSLVVGEIYATVPRGLEIEQFERRDAHLVHIVGRCVQSDLLAVWVDHLQGQSTIASVIVVSTTESENTGVTFGLDVTLKGAL